MTSTCPLLMLIAPHFGLCACGTGGGQKFPLGLCRPIQGFLPFLGMWAKDYRKVNMRETQHFLFLIPRCARPSSPFPSFLLEEHPAVTDLQCFLSHTVGLVSTGRQRPLDRRVDRRATALTFTNV